MTQRVFVEEVKIGVRIDCVLTAEVKAHVLIGLFTEQILSTYNGC